jgi:hypothetical protein
MRERPAIREQGSGRKRFNTEVTEEEHRGHGEDERREEGFDVGS